MGGVSHPRFGKGGEMESYAGWLTFHEVLEVTGLSYRHLKDLVEQGRLTPHTSGQAELYDPAEIARFHDTPAA